MRFAAIGLALAAAATAAPAQMAEPPHIILVTGDGRALTPPDQADLAFEIRGEGASADEASTMVAARMKDIRGGSPRCSVRRCISTRATIRSRR